MKSLLTCAIVFSFAASLLAEELKTEHYTAPLPAGWTVTADNIVETETAQSADGSRTITIRTVEARGGRNLAELRKMLIGDAAGLTGGKWKLSGEPRPFKVGTLDGFKLEAMDTDGAGSIAFFVASSKKFAYSIQCLSINGNDAGAAADMKTIIDGFLTVGAGKLSPVVVDNQFRSVDPGTPVYIHAYWIGALLIALFIGLFVVRRRSDGSGKPETVEVVPPDIDPAAPPRKWAQAGDDDEKTK